MVQRQNTGAWQGIEQTPICRVVNSWLRRATLCVLLPVACVDPPEEAIDSKPTPTVGVMLRGSFDAIAKPAQGTVELTKTQAGYELSLNGVTVADPGPVHVYLVGLERVNSTKDLDQVEEKYDFGPLETQGNPQRIRLPGRPAATLRSVALVNPKFGVVLAASELREPTR